MQRTIKESKEGKVFISLGPLLRSHVGASTDTFVCMNNYDFAHNFHLGEFTFLVIIGLYLLKNIIHL